MSQARPDTLAGIFTERDLLKWIDEIQHGGHWEKPVAHVMSKPVKTLPMGRFDEAAELMLSESFRHLPLTHPDGHGGSRLIGIVSIRDLLAMELAGKKGRTKGRIPAQKRRRKRLVYFLCGDSSLGRLESKGLQALAERPGTEGKARWQLERLPADTHALSPLADELSSGDLAILDVDGIPASIWAPFLREVNAREDSPPLLVLLSEGLHGPKEVATLQSLSKAGKWPAFLKPVQVSEFIAAFEKALG